MTTTTCLSSPQCQYVSRILTSAAEEKNTIGDAKEEEGWQSSFVVCLSFDDDDGKIKCSHLCLSPVIINILHVRISFLTWWAWKPICPWLMWSYQNISSVLQFFPRWCRVKTWQNIFLPFSSPLLFWPTLPLMHCYCWNIYSEQLRWISAKQIKRTVDEPVTSIYTLIFIRIGARF